MPRTTKSYKRKRSTKRGNASKRKVTKRRTRVRRAPYRRSIPRMLSLATYKPKTKTIRFQWEKEYLIQPTTHLVGSVGLCLGTYFQFRTNSICNIGSVTYRTGTTQVVTNKCWDGNDDIAYVQGNGTQATTTQAPGFEQHQNDYRHFTVLGSRISATAEPVGSYQTDAAEGMKLGYRPAQLMIIKSGTSMAIHESNSNLPGATAPADCSVLAKLPYVKQAAVQLVDGIKATGARLSMGYSARKFEGVKDVQDNSQLKGFMGRSDDADMGTGTASNPLNPAEGSYFTVLYGSRIDGGGQVAGWSNDIKLPPVLLKIKMSYIVKLTEPTYSEPMNNID